MKRNMSPCRVAYVLAAGVLLSVACGCLIGCSTSKPQSSEEKIRASAEDLRVTMERAVEDAGKRRQMQTLADQAMAELKKGAEELATLRQEQERLNKDYNATRDDYKRMEERLVAVRRKQIEQIIATRQAIASMATDDEWKIMAGRDLALLND